MIKKSKLSLNLIVLPIFALLMALSPSTVKADVGEVPMPGGTVTIGDKTDVIQMKSEDVVFKVLKNDGVFSKSNVGYYAHVTARFTMHNLSSSLQAKELFFPFYGGFEQETEFFDRNQAINVKVTVDGKPASISYRELTPYSDYGPPVAVFNASFQPGSDTEILVEYDVRAVGEGKSYNRAFSYVIETGSHWAGKIGQGKIVFDFDQDIDSTTVFATVNPFFKPKDGKLVWEFKDLEPDENYNIRVAFDPDLLNVWAKRPSYIKDIYSSNLRNRTYLLDNIRSNPGDQPLPGGEIHSEAINLVDYESDDNGWLVDLEKDGQVKENNWVEFALDGRYKVGELQIRSGYKGPWRDIDQYYDTFRRPKNITITYSDGKTQEVTLQDLPAEYQTVKLLDKETNKIRVTVKDYYNGVGYGDGYLAIGRIKLANMVKVPPVKDTSSSQPSSNKDKGGISPVVYWAGGSVLGAAAIACVTVMIIKRRSSQKIAKKTAKTEENSDNKVDKKE